MYNPKLHFYFVGIGGSGMAGLAEILLASGFRVSGSDSKDSEILARLRSLGAKVFVGHHPSQLAEDVSLLVFSSAINAANVEIVEGRKRGLPVVRRAEILAELMRLKYGVAVAGSHGKTSTTSMIAAVLEKGSLDPTVIIGGRLKALGSGGKLGKGAFLVAETDESDRSFLLLKPTIAVITNIDQEHLLAYDSMEDLENSFEYFANEVPFYGLAVLCLDDLRVRELRQRYAKRAISYGFSSDADIRIVGGTIREGGYSTAEVLFKEQRLGQLRLQVPGKHMLLNALAAIAVGLELQVPAGQIFSALEEFGGVERRLEVIGEEGGVLVINDYAHHPTEIKASISALSEAWGNRGGRLHVFFQPHRFSRTKDCFPLFSDIFSEADRLVMTEVYSAGEIPIAGFDGLSLWRSIKHPDKHFAQDLDYGLEQILAGIRADDVVVCMGAGTIGSMPQKILQSLRASAPSRPQNFVQ